jgi:hypothetical protein
MKDEDIEIIKNRVMEIQKQAEISMLPQETIQELFNLVETLDKSLIDFAQTIDVDIEEEDN